VTTLSADCRVCRFGSDRTQITSSIVDKFLGGNIFVQANAWDIMQYYSIGAFSSGQHVDQGSYVYK